MDRVRLQRTPPFIEPLNYECQRRLNEDDVPKGSELAYTLYLDSSVESEGGAVLLLREPRLPVAGARRILRVWCSTVHPTCTK